jgi:hypothetical protein
VVTVNCARLSACAMSPLAQHQNDATLCLILVSAGEGLGVYCRNMKPELLAAAYLLERLHGAAFAAALLEEHGLTLAQAMRLLADRPCEKESLGEVKRAKYPNQMANLRTEK